MRINIFKFKFKSLCIRIYMKLCVCVNWIGTGEMALEFLRWSLMRSGAASTQSLSSPFILKQQPRAKRIIIVSPARRSGSRLIAAPETTNTHSDPNHLNPSQRQVQSNRTNHSLALAWPWAQLRAGLTNFNWLVKLGFGSICVCTERSSLGSLSWCLLGPEKNITGSSFHSLSLLLLAYLYIH